MTAGEKLMEQKYEFEAFPGTSLTVCRFQGLQNGAELKEAIVAKTLAADAAFIDRDAVPDMFLLQLAAFKALVSQEEGSLMTRSLHADIIVNLSGSKHIAAALSTFGVTAATQDLLVAMINASEGDMKALKEAIKGEQVEVDKHVEMQKDGEDKLKKLYKTGDAELGIGSLADSAACKGALLQC